MRAYYRSLLHTIDSIPRERTMDYDQGLLRQEGETSYGIILYFVLSEEKKKIWLFRDMIICHYYFRYLYSFILVNYFLSLVANHYQKRVRDLEDLWIFHIFQNLWRFLEIYQDLLRFITILSRFIEIFVDSFETFSVRSITSGVELESWPKLLDTWMKC